MKALVLTVLLFIPVCAVLGESAPIKPITSKISLVTVKYPPYCDPELAGGGIVTQIARAALAVKGLDMELTYQPWVRVISDTQSGRFDGVLGIWYRQDRDEWLAYSEPLAENKMVLLKRANWKYAFKGIADLAHYRVGNVRGYASPPVFKENGVEFDEVYDDSINLKKLIIGRIHFALIDHATAFYLIKKDYPNIKVEFETIGPEFEVEPSYVAIRRSNPNHERWIRVLNEGIQTIKKNGVYTDIQNQYGIKESKVMRGAQP